MNFFFSLVAFIIIPGIVFSQIPEKKNVSVTDKASARKAGHYLKKMNHSPGYSVAYYKVMSALEGYSRKDTLLAQALTNRLSEYPDNIFYQLMRVRLEWEYKERLLLYPLDSAKALIRNNSDSANYYHTLGIYFKDTMTARMARQLGFVRVNAKGEEIVDWRKMRNFKWADPVCYEQISHAGYTAYKKVPMKDSALLYFKKAIELVPGEFRNIKELVLYLSQMWEDTAIQELIKLKQENYESKEKAWLIVQLAASFIRQNKIGEAAVLYKEARKAELMTSKDVKKIKSLFHTIPHSRRCIESL